MEKTTDIGVRPKSFEGNCGTCSTSCLSEAGLLLDKFDSFYIKRNNERLEFSKLDYRHGSPGWDQVSFEVFHVDPTYTFEEPYSRESQRVDYRYPPWCPEPFARPYPKRGRDLLVSQISVFSCYDSYGLGIHCGDLTVQDSGSQFDVRTENWGQDGIRGSRSLIDHNIFYLLLKTTCENKGFSANTSNHPHVVSTPSMYGSLTDRNSYIQKEKISANLSRKTFLYQLGGIAKWLTCDGCPQASSTFGSCQNTVTKYTLGDSPLALGRLSRGSEVFDTEQEALDAVKLTPPEIFIGQVITPPQPRKQLVKGAFFNTFGLYQFFYGGPGSLRIGCKSQLQTWGWVDGGSYYEQVSTAASYRPGCAGPPSLPNYPAPQNDFLCGTRKWQPYGRHLPVRCPMNPLGFGHPCAPPYLGCVSQKGHWLSANGLVDTNLNQFKLSTPNDFVDLSSCDVVMSSLLPGPQRPQATRGSDLVGMAFYSAPISSAATANSFDFNFQEIYKREFSWKNLNPTMKPFDVDITASM